MLRPSEAVSELCRMLQAEVEHLSHSGADDGFQKEDAENKRQKLQNVQSPSTPKTPSPSHPTPKASGAKPCKNWLTAGGCSYGSSCQFYHDQSEEKMKGRCFSCSAEDHWTDTCPVKARLKAEATAAMEDPSSLRALRLLPVILLRERARVSKKEREKGIRLGLSQIPRSLLEVPRSSRRLRHSHENSTAAINAEILNVLRSIRLRAFGRGLLMMRRGMACWIQGRLPPSGRGPSRK